MVIVPLEVSWCEPDGAVVKEGARAWQVNAQGALLQMRTYPPVGSRIQLVNFLSAESAEARVLGMRHSKEGELLGVAIELVVPSESFWGVNFHLKRTTAELFKLEQALRSGGIDLRLLKEFRDAVEYVRVVTGAFLELQECQLEGRDATKVVSLLVAERVRRAAYLCEEVNADLGSGQVPHEMRGLAELARVVERLQQRLRLALGPRAPRHEFASRT